MKDTTVTTYTLPKALQRPGLPTQIGMCELSGHEELMAHRVGSGDDARAGVDATKRAIRELDGKAIDGKAWKQEDLDTFWESWGPKVRALLLDAYIRMAAPDKGESDSFFASAEVRVPSPPSAT